MTILSLLASIAGAEPTRTAAAATPSRQPPPGAATPPDAPSCTGAPGPRERRARLARKRDWNRRHRLRRRNTRRLPVAAAQQQPIIARGLQTWMAAVAHDLRSPLTPILGWVQLWLRDPSAPNPRAAETMLRNADQMLGLIDELAHSAEFLRGTPRMAPVPLQIAGLVNEIVDSLSLRAQEEQVSLVTEIATDLPALQADAGHLQRILANLLGNALKFTPAGGKVTIGVEQVGRTRRARTQPAIRIRVRDSGRGIDPQQLTQLFDPFHQVEGSPAQRGEGLGLGLYIVKTLVRAHGGTISARSAGNGQGATFTVTLPLRDRRPRVLRRTHSAPSGPPIAPADTPLTADQQRLMHWTQQVAAALAEPALAVKEQTQRLTHPLSPEERADALQEVARNGSLLRTMNEDLLDLTRILTGTLKLSPVRLSPVPLLREILTTTAGHERVALAGDDALTLDSDAGRLAQVLRILLRETLAMAPADAPVQITVQPIRGSGERQLIRVRIAHAGPALEHGAVSRLFELPDAAQSRRPGLDAGPFIARGLVTALGGTLRVHSPVDGGAGTAFLLDLPAGNAAAAPP